MSDAKARFDFLLAFLRDPLSTGSLTPSSRELAIELIEPLPLHGQTKILEIGPGTGAVTKVLAERLSHAEAYQGVELNSDFLSDLGRRFPKFRFLEGSAEDLLGLGVPTQSLDGVVSAVPWTLLKPATRAKIFSQIRQTLKPEGHFTTFLYWHLLHLPVGKKIVREISKSFSRIERSPIVFKNFPPAVVLHCQSRKK